MIKPTQGRIVYYKEKGIQWPAMITEVRDDRSITVKIFTETEIHSKSVQLLQDDDTPTSNSWAEWMDFQKGQAAKSDTDVADLQKAVADLAKTVDGIAGGTKTFHDRLGALENSLKKAVTDQLGPVTKPGAKT